MYYMYYFSFKNGSLTRERIMEQCADGSWDKFNELLRQTPPGNNGNIGNFGRQRQKIFTQCRLFKIF